MDHNFDAVIKNIQDQIIDYDPEVGIILGSGIKNLDEKVSNSVKLSYNEVEWVNEKGIDGHAYNMTVGELGGKDVILLNGRFHFYEDYDMGFVASPSIVLSRIGVDNMIVTNAAGAVNENYGVGDIMVINDHINNMGDNPLAHYSVDNPFLDMSNAYDDNLQELALDVLSDSNLNNRNGVYLANKGPVYETPAEVNLARAVGADAVGMSTVPEVIMARHENIDVLGMSCITNMAAGISNELSHEEVVEIGVEIEDDFSRVVKNIISKM